MSVALALPSILGALLVGAVSPGPSFVLVARTSVVASRGNGLAAALGMGAGGVFFAALALLGLQAVLAQALWFYLGLKLFGGAYLLYLAVRLWRAAADPLDFSSLAEPPPSALRIPFLLGLATQLSNPKTAVVYGSVFAAFLPVSVPIWLILALPLAVFAVEVSWYGLVALAFSSKRPRAAYLRSKTAVDRVAASVMGLLSLKLIVEVITAYRTA